MNKKLVICNAIWATVLSVTLLVQSVYGATITFTVDNTIAAEIVAAAQRKWAKNGGESDTNYVKRITQQKFWRPLLEEHRRLSIVEAQPQPTPVTDGDLGTD